MAEPLKNQFGPDIPKKIAAMIKAVHPDFPVRAFLKASLDGYEQRELMARARHIAAAMRAHLPSSYPDALHILVATFRPTTAEKAPSGMESFLYLAYSFFIAEHGLDYFEISMRAQHALTQRFTAEFCIRPYIERYPEESLAILAQWARDPVSQVRRLVSEGTRPRLPWAPRLTRFMKDPRPVLELLELLKDDPELSVRRSVANNLNDIGKDHPGLLLEVAERWLRDAGEERAWIVRHALRSAVKRGDADALRLLGYGAGDGLEVRKASVTPRRAFIGGSVSFSCDVLNTADRPVTVLVDFRVLYMKANGRQNPKVFKLTSIRLAAGEHVRVKKTLSLVNRTTRSHYPGRHDIELLLNGATRQVGSFEVLPAA